MKTISVDSPVTPTEERVMGFIVKAILISLASVVIFAIAVFGFWQIRHAYYEPKKLAAMAFCETLIPLIEAAKTPQGTYPEKLDTKWIEGKRIPELIQTPDFYSASHGSYHLWFRNPGDFMDDIWSCSSNGAWSNFD